MDFSIFESLFALREELHDTLPTIGKPGDAAAVALLKNIAGQRDRVLKLAMKPRPPAIATILRAAAAPLPSLAPEKDKKKPAAKANKMKKAK